MRATDNRGYAMAALLVGMSIMAVLMSVALPAWRSAAQREKEAELIFRGQQYARAVALFQRRFPGQFPPNLDVLLSGKFLRKRYKDPMTEDGEFQLLLAGQAAPGQGAPPASGQGALRASGLPAQVLERARELAQQGQQQGRGGGQNQLQVRVSLPGGTATVQAGGQAGIMGVVSKSTADSMRLYNGRGKYNEWAFVATQASTEAGTGGRGAQAPGGRGGPARGAQPALPGRGAQPTPPGRGQTQPLFPPPARGRGF